MCRCSDGVAQGGANPADKRAALHQLHPGGPDGAHQPGFLRGQGRFLQGDGGDQQELAQRRRQRQNGRRESGFNVVNYFFLCMSAELVGDNCPWVLFTGVPKSS